MTDKNEERFIERLNKRLEERGACDPFGNAQTFDGMSPKWQAIVLTVFDVVSAMAGENGNGKTERRIPEECVVHGHAWLDDGKVDGGKYEICERCRMRRFVSHGGQVEHLGIAPEGQSDV